MNPQVLLDQMIDEFVAAHPAMEFAITLAPKNAAQIPMDGTSLSRSVNGREGTYSGPVYRDALVNTPEVLDWLIIVNPVDGIMPESAGASALYGDLRTGTFSDKLTLDNQS